MNDGKTREEFRALILAEQAPLPRSYFLDYDGLVRFIPAFTDSGRQSVSVVAAVVFTWRDATNPSSVKIHNFVVAYDPHTDRFAGWCGDMWVEGRARDQDGRRDRAIEYLTAKGLVVGAGGVPLHDGVGFDASTGCNFFRNGNKCKHRNATFQHIVSALDVDAFLDRLQSLAAPLAGVGPAGVPAAPAVGIDPMLLKLHRYSFHRNVLLEGDKGWGKTWLITEYAGHAMADVGKVVYIGGHEGLESVDLLGHMIKTSDGSLAWKDGKLSEAFRSAAAGVKTLVVFDEVLRVRKRELSVLVAALAPHADGRLHLSTGRPMAVENGLAVEEVLSSDRHCLWMVCTTNVGAGYEVEDMEEALSDRFPIVLRMDGDSDRLRRKLGPIIAAKGFSPSLLAKLVALFDGYQIGRVNSEVTRQMNPRHLCEIVDTARDESEIKDLVQDRLPQWVDRDVDGKLIQRQSDYVTTLIDSTFAGPRR